HGAKINLSRALFVYQTIVQHHLKSHLKDLHFYLIVKQQIRLMQLHQSLTIHLLNLTSNSDPLWIQITSLSLTIVDLYSKLIYLFFNIYDSLMIVYTKMIKVIIW